MMPKRLSQEFMEDTTGYCWWTLDHAGDCGPVGGVEWSGVEWSGVSQ
jgi:hypothetical protein